MYYTTFTQLQVNNNTMCTSVYVCLHRYHTYSIHTYIDVHACMDKYIDIDVNISIYIRHKHICT